MNSARQFTSLPFLLIAVAALIVGLSAWQTIVLARGNQEIRGDLLAKRKEIVGPRGEAAAADSAGLAKVQAELEEARGKLRATESQAQKLADELKIEPAAELKSLGRSEQLAAKGATLVQGMEKISKEQHTAQIEGRRLNVDAKSIAEWLVNTDAIGELEADPGAIADVNAHALRTTLGLDGDTTRRLREQLAAEFEQLRKRGLDRPHRPNEGREDWYAKRDRMLLEAAARIEAQIPVSQRKPNVVSQIMNLGTGFRTRVQQSPDAGPGMELYYESPGMEPIRF